MSKTFIHSLLMTLAVPLVSYAQFSATFLGDSHSTPDYGFFENLLGTKASGQMQSTVRVNSGRAVCGAQINAFLDSKVKTRCGFRQLKQKKRSWKKTGYSAPSKTWLKSKSDLVIVQLGGNHWKKPSSAYNAAMSLIQRIVSSGKQCLWIGTPAAHNPKKQALCKKVSRARKSVAIYIQRAISDLKQQGIHCDFIDSHSMLKGEKLYAPDCRHYSGKGYKTWANKIEPTFLKALGRKSGPHHESSANHDTTTVLTNNYFSFSPQGNQ